MLFKADHSDSGLYGARASNRLTHLDVFPFSFNDPVLGQLIVASPAKSSIARQMRFFKASLRLDLWVLMKVQSYL